jgi:hypothetical protein
MTTRRRRRRLNPNRCHCPLLPLQMINCKC